jgi:hypothetical protein
MNQLDKQLDTLNPEKVGAWATMSVDGKCDDVR